MADIENFEVVETSVENEVTGNEDLQAKLEEAGTLSEKACIAIGALALAGAVALGNCAWKGGKAVVGKAKTWNEQRKAKKAEAKKTEKAEETTEEASKESKEDPEKK